MRHYLFELLAGDYEGEEFLVGAFRLSEAYEIADDVARNAESFDEDGEPYYKYHFTLTEEEAEMSGLDEY